VLLRHKGINEPVDAHITNQSNHSFLTALSFPKTQSNNEKSEASKSQKQYQEAKGNALSRRSSTSNHCGKNGKMEKATKKRKPPNRFDFPPTTILFSLEKKKPNQY